MRFNKDKLHISAIVAGTIYLSLGLFNINLWFDETYTLGLINQNFSSMYSIANTDVHPILYYFLLKLFTIIFGNSIFICRLFSIIPFIILMILGYTKIKKDFSQETGLIFSILIAIMPVSMHYATQIRMYSWSVLFVTLTALYAYDIIKKSNTKYFCLFTIFSICSAYTHYYALITIAMINAILFIYIIFKKREILKKFFLFAIIELILYLPGLKIFITQTLQVQKGFWITINYPDIFYEIYKYYFSDTIKNSGLLIIALIINTLFVIKLIISNNKFRNIARVNILVYMLVIAIGLIVSRKQAVFITRYLIPMLGIYAISLSIVISSISSNMLKSVVIFLILLISICNTSKIFQVSYNKQNNEVYNVIDRNIQNDDIFIFSNINTGSILVSKYKNNKHYFYNKDYWPVDISYQAFKPQLDIVYSLENFSGRIWLIDSSINGIYNMVTDFYKNYKIDKIIYDVEIYNPYADVFFNISLININ